MMGISGEWILNQPYIYNIYIYYLYLIYYLRYQHTSYIICFFRMFSKVSDGFRSSGWWSRPRLPWRQQHWQLRHAARQLLFLGIATVGLLPNDLFILDSHPEVDSMLNVEPQKHSHLCEVCLKVQLFIYSDYTYKMRVQHNLTINNRGLYFRIGMMMDNADLTINNT